MREVPVDVLEKLSRQLIDAVTRASDADLQAVREGRAMLLLHVDGAPRQRPARKREQHSLTPNEADDLIEKLRLSTSREDGLNLLVQHCKLKEDLLRVAKRLDVPIPRDSTIERTQQHIIEATIGYKLRSNAIQNR